MGSTAFDPSTTIGAALQSLDLLEQDTDHARILGSSLNQQINESGVLDDTVEIYWGLYGRPGVFTTRVVWDIDWLAQAYFAIGEKLALVQRIYDGLPDKNAVPDTGGVTPKPLPGLPVAI